MALATRCPHCQTVFRIVPDQLKLHRGLVRCGHCREVFDGVLHQVEPPVRPTPPAPVAPTPVQPDAVAAPSAQQPDTPPHAAGAAAVAAEAVAAEAAAHAETHEHEPVSHESTDELTHEPAQETLQETSHEPAAAAASIEASHQDADEHSVSDAVAHDEPDAFAGHDLSHDHAAQAAARDALADEARHELEASHVSDDESHVAGTHDAVAESPPVHEPLVHDEHDDEVLAHPEHGPDSLGRAEPHLAPDFDLDDAGLEQPHHEGAPRAPAPATPPEWDPAFGELPPGAPLAPFSPDVEFRHEPPGGVLVSTPLGATPPLPDFDAPDHPAHAPSQVAEHAVEPDHAHEPAPVPAAESLDELAAHRDVWHDASREVPEQPASAEARHEYEAEGYASGTHEHEHAGVTDDEHVVDPFAKPYDVHAHDVGHDTEAAAAYATTEYAESAAEHAAEHAERAAHIEHDATRYGHDDDVIDVEPTSATPNYGANPNTDPWAPPPEARMEPALSLSGSAATGTSAFAPLADEASNEFRIRLEPHEVDEPQLHPARRILGWIVALLLLVLLFLQLAWWQREPIMAHWPNTVGAYRSTCAKLGCVVTPPRGIDQLQIESSTLTQTTVANQFNLSMSLHNRAALALAWPSIEISLLDQNNQLVIRRVVMPAQYLPAGVDANAGIGADGHQAVNLQLTATGTAPANYKVLIFYP